MKRKNFYQVAAWLMAAAATVACTGDDWLERTPARTWSATGIAGVDDASELTRALSVGGDNGKVLYFNWNGGEELKVYDGTSPVGTMTATVDESNTALADLDGDITGNYSEGNTLTYYYPDVAMSFTGQKGTIADLSKNFQYLESSVKVKGTDSETGKLTMGFAALKYRMAVVRLRLTDASGKRLHVKELEITSANNKLVQSVAANGTKNYGPLNITADEENGEFPGDIFVALLNESTSADTYTLTAKVGNSVYSSTEDAQKITARFLPDHFYTGVRQLTKTVDGDVETSGDFTFSTVAPQTYTGSPIVPSGVTVTYNGTDVTSDCELHYLGNTNAGKAFIVAFGKSGSVTDKSGATTFTINPKALTDGMAGTIASQTYTGSAIEPGVTITDGSLGTLTEGTDYTVSYEDNINVGTATATITGTGNYTGELTRTFSITAGAGTLTLSKTSVTLNEVADGETKETETVSVTAHSGDLSLSGYDSSVATAVLSGTTITITGVAAGTTTITVTSAANGNYAEATKTITVTVNALSRFEAVDLGLSVKWANMNLGAESETDYGDYYAWGETSTKSDYSWANYSLCNGSNSTLTKYNNNASYGTVDNKTTLEAADDAAHVVLGDNWYMPTADEIQELLDNTTREWKTNYNGSGVNGYLFTSTKEGYTDKSIFLPAAGYRGGTSPATVGSSGYYWSSSLRESDARNGRRLYFYSGLAYVSHYYRSSGYTVRAVQKN